MSRTGYVSARLLLNISTWMPLILLQELTKSTQRNLHCTAALATVLHVHDKVTRTTFLILTQEIKRNIICRWMMNLPSFCVASNGPCSGWQLWQYHTKSLLISAYGLGSNPCNPCSPFHGITTITSYPMITLNSLAKPWPKLERLNAEWPKVEGPSVEWLKVDWLKVENDWR